MDQLNGVRTLIDRLGLPPRIKFVVTELEKREGPLEQVAETPGGQEVRRILGMVDGQNLCAAVLAALCNSIPEHELPVDELAADADEQDTRTPYEHWIEAVEDHPDPIVLLLVDGNYMTFDGQAESLSGLIEEHHIIIDGRMALSLSQNTQARWVSKIQQANIDVLLVDNDGDEPVTIYANDIEVNDATGAVIEEA